MNLLFMIEIIFLTMIDQQVYLLRETNLCVAHLGQDGCGRGKKMVKLERQNKFKKKTAYLF